MTDTSTSDTVPGTLTRPLWGAALSFAALCLALILWSTFAPLATTVRVSGALKSSLLSHDIQHAFGGQLAAVLVREHDQVLAGDPLFRLDVRTQRQALEETRLQIKLLEEEIVIIEQFVNNGSFPDRLPTVEPYLFAQYQAEAAQIKAQIDADSLGASMAESKLRSIDQQLDILSERLAMAEAQANHSADLRAKGVATQQDADKSQNALLTLQTQIEAQYVEQITLHSQIVQAEHSARATREGYRRQLLTTLNANQARLPDLRKKASQFQRELDTAILRAPVSGTIVDISHTTAETVAARGETLARVVQPLDTPELELEIPISAIDQVYAGMTGLLTIAALPQRNMPETRVELTQISPQARRDQDGNPVSYPARARIDPDDLHATRLALGPDVRFSSDMPVSVSLTGRKTTFGSYLFGGFAKVFQDGLQN